MSHWSDSIRIEDLVVIGDTVEPHEGVMMPNWNPGATVVKVGMPTNDTPKYAGGDWIIISSYGGWLPRVKFKKRQSGAGFKRAIV